MTDTAKPDTSAAPNTHPLMRALLGELGVGAFLTPHEATIAFHAINDAAIQLEDGARGFQYDGDTDTAEIWFTQAMELYAIAKKLDPDQFI